MTEHDRPVPPAAPTAPVTQSQPADPAAPPPTVRRSGLQITCAVLMLALIALAMIATCIITIMELPPIGAINRAQDAVIGGHFGMLGFLIVMIPLLAAALALSIPIIRLVRRYMAARGIPWVDEDGNVID